MGIRVLPDELINQIAAGEVIEKPAFVVKELIENAIDAKATEIIVMVRDGGKSEIIVADNGEGIFKKDLELSVKRHATSKLLENDLNNISFLGFRGEALPSIASVSNLKIESFKKKEDESWGINVNNNKISDIYPSSRIIGTKVSVLDLFKLVPARLKFLKGNQSENFHTQQVIRRLALSNFNIAFKLSIDERLVLNFINEGNSAEALNKRILDILGKEFFENSIQFKNQKFFGEHPVLINGFVGLPTLNKANYSSQYLFVNGRPVQDRALSSVIKFAYNDTLPRGRHPIYCIFLEVPNFFVDVNVHPTKLEVRFRDYPLIKSLIISSIQNCMNRELRKSANINLENNLTSISKNQFKNSESNNNQELLANLNLKPLVKNHLEDLDKLNEEELIKENNYPLGSAIYQFNKNYILSISTSGIILIDQHAAHERIVMEKMKEGMNNNNIEKQLLLIPIIIDLDNTQLETLNENIKVLENLGFKIEEFGKNSILIREIPSLIKKEYIKDIISDLCDDINITGFPVDFQEKVNLVIANICCHRSIRSGRSLSLDEMNSLLREMEITPNSGQCNHGRPTSVTLSLDQIEKLFQRR
mgnify:FL=1